MHGTTLKKTDQRTTCRFMSRWHIMDKVSSSQTKVARADRTQTLLHTRLELVRARWVVVMVMVVVMVAFMLCLYFKLLSATPATKSKSRDLEIQVLKSIRSRRSRDLKFQKFRGVGLELYMHKRSRCLKYEKS